MASPELTLRAGSIVAVVAGLLALAAIGTFAFDRLAETDLVVDAEHPPFVLHCARRPITTAWWLEGSENDGWRAELAGSGDLEPLDGERRFFPTAGVWATRRAAWAAYVLDREPRRCTDAPEWLEPEEPEEEPLDLGAEVDVAALLEPGETGRHDRTLRPGSRDAVPLRYCAVEAARGLRWCVETETRRVDRAVLPEASIVVEVLDLAPRVLLGRSLDDGRVVWRTAVPEDAADVWLVRAEDGYLGVRANESFFALEERTGALERITPEGSEVCSMPPLVVAQGDGVLGVTLEHPATFVPIAHTVRRGTTDCRRRPDGTIWVLVGSPPDRTAMPDEPIRVTDPNVAPRGGAALYVIESDGTLRETWSIPWAHWISEGPTTGLFATDDDENRVPLRYDESGLHLAATAE